MRIKKLLLCDKYCVSIGQLRFFPMRITRLTIYKITSHYYAWAWELCDSRPSLHVIVGGEVQKPGKEMCKSVIDASASSENHKQCRKSVNRFWRVPETLMSASPWFSCWLFVPLWMWKMSFILKVLLYLYARLFQRE